jgi:multiple sugar transport system permease protein
LKMKITTPMRVSRALVYAFLIILTVVTILPLLVTLVNATRSNAEVVQSVSLLPGSSLAHNWNVITSYGINPIRSALNSLYVAGLSSSFTIYGSCMMAYALVVYDYKLRSFQASFILAVMMIPGGITLIGFYKMIHSMGMMNNHWALILPGIAAPGCVYFIRQYMRGALSLEIVASGRIDGAGEFRIFNTIVLPLLTPAIFTQMIFTFVGSWNNWLMPSLLLSDINKITMPVMVGLLRDNRYSSEKGAQFLGIASAVIPITIFYTILSRYIIAGIALGGLKE